jgi:type 1 glutamine amidotransferase
MALKRFAFLVLAVCSLSAVSPIIFTQASAEAPLEWGPGIKVLIVSGGGWHEWDRFFNKVDTATLNAAGITSVHYTESSNTAAAELPKVDVIVTSVNMPGFDTPAFRKALFDHVNAGKGVILLHSGAWHNWGWPEYDRDLVGGTYNSHDGEGPFQEHVLVHHPVTEGVPDTFTVVDETYHTVADAGGPGVDVLVEAQRGAGKYASVWITHNPKARIVCIALGHDANSHNNPNFKKLLCNAVTWAAGK